MFDDFVRLPLTIFITRSTNKVWKYKKEYKTIDLYTFHPKKDALPILQECPLSFDNKLFVNCESCCQAVAKLSTKPQRRGWIISVGKWHRLVHWKYDCILFLALQPKLFLFSCLLKVWQILRLLSRQLKVREHFAILLRLEIFVRGQNVCWFEWVIKVYFTKGHRFGILA